MVEAHHLQVFRDSTLGQPRYLDAQREPFKLVKGLIRVVPERVLNRSWAEVS